MNWKNLICLKDNKMSETDDNVIVIKAREINPEGRHPEDILSRLCNNDFCFDGVQCGCMESFLQSLRFDNEEVQRKFCVMSAFDLLNRLEWHDDSDWQEIRTLWWKGKPFQRDSHRFRNLVYRAYSEMFRWSDRFRSVLMSTQGKKLVFDSGKSSPLSCILTDKEFIKILTRLRNNRRFSNWEHMPSLWPNSYGVEEDYI